MNNNYGNLNNTGTLTNDGALNNYNTITVSGKMNGIGNYSQFGINSALTINSGGSVAIANTTNLASGILSGGSWNIIAGTGNASLSIGNGNISTNTTNVRLSGAGAQFNQLNGLQNNQGTLQVDSGASFTNTVQLNNTGVLNVGIQNNNASGTLINSGTLNNNRGGTLNINSGATMINNTGGMLSNDWGLNISGGGTLTNAGTLINNQGGFTVAQTAIVNGTGSITQMSGGTLTIDGSVSQNNIAINGGELTGTGHITTTNGLTVSAGGTVNPGDFNPGTLTVNGNASFSGGTLDIHINNATQFGALIASEAANFTQGGNIVISNGNNPASSFVGDSFAVLSAGTISNNVLNAITFNGFGNLIETETLTFNPTDTIETLNITFTSASITLPVPASAWLFSSIFAGFIGFNRRRPV